MGLNYETHRKETGRAEAAHPAIFTRFPDTLIAHGQPIVRAPFHTKVIAATANEAPHVLDGLLYHKSSLVIDEHDTDTGGFSDHVCAMCRLLGFLFAPRIRDLKDKRLCGSVSDPRAGVREVVLQI